LVNLWGDTGGGSPDKRYVVQTNPKIITRCVLMATDPGDLVLDPTCGSGTTAMVAEEFGRRWITIDTSRVALAIARERLLSAVLPYYVLQDEGRGVDGGLRYKTLKRVTLRSIARAEEPEEVILVDDPAVDTRKTRVVGPFTIEALSRYSAHPDDGHGTAQAGTQQETTHVSLLLDALRQRGIPRPGGPPMAIESLNPLASTGPLQAEGVVTREQGPARFAVSLGPRFGAITMAQVSDALRHAISFDLVVFAGFAVSADAQERLSQGHIGSTEVALLMANPDLLAGDLLKNTTASQTFRLYISPDVHLTQDQDGYHVQVEGVDSYDAATGQVVSFGRTGIQAWFLDDDFDGLVFRVSQAFFPVTNAWEKLQKALRGTVDADLLAEMHGWTSLPFSRGEHGKVAVRVIADDGNESEVVLDLPEGE
jgi:adenine-specific DNA-methyltransferase